MSTTTTTDTTDKALRTSIPRDAQGAVRTPLCNRASSVLVRGANPDNSKAVRVAGLLGTVSGLKTAAQLQGVANIMEDRQ